MVELYIFSPAFPPNPSLPFPSSSIPFSFPFNWPNGIARWWWSDSLSVVERQLQAVERRSGLI